MFVKGYRYRVDTSRPHGWSGMVLVRRPYERAAVLRARSEPGEILELHWYRSEADYERALGRPAAEIHGMELAEPFPGLVVLPGTQVEELEFDDAPGIAALAFPHGPPPPVLDPEQRARLRALLRALIERIAPALPEGFSLTFTGDSLLLHRDLERLDEIGLEWAIDGEEVLASMVRSALDRLQDTIAEETTDPWPGRGFLPSAGAEVRDGTLRLWYGSSDEPVLAFEPIPIR